jgi:uncharacterized protein YbaR (Trm112 family)
VVLIFGWGAGEAKDMGEVAPATCPNCHNAVYLHHIRSEKRVSLYFVPLVPYGTDEYLACPICRQGLQLQAGQSQIVQRMRAATAVHRRGRVGDAQYAETVRQFWAHIGVDPSGRQLVHPAASADAATVAAAPDGSGGAASPAGPSLADQLGRLGELRDQGILTDDEFATAKRQLLEH